MTPSAHGERILVAGGGEELRQRVADELERAGYRPATAATSAGAAETIAANDFDLLVCVLDGTPLDPLEQARAADRDLATIVVAEPEDATAAGAAIRLGADGYLVQPLAEGQLAIAVAGALRRRQAEIENRAHRERLEDLVKQRTLPLIDAVRRLERSTEELQRSREETLRRLSRAGEYWDEAAGKDVDRMGRICHLLAERLGLDPEHAQLIRMAVPLHDVGKVGIPDEILRQPRALNDEERAAMQRHPEIGHRILSGSGSPLLDVAATIAWTHQEKYDGSGYPRGLAGEEIPVEGRIAAVADVFDALLGARVHRPARPLDEALQVLRDGRGTHFDPEVIDAFFDALPEISEVVGFGEARETPGVRVVIVEDHEGVRRGIELLLRDAGIEVVGAAGGAGEAEALIARRRPDVAVVDVGLAGEDGLELTRRLLAREDAPRVLLYTGAEDERTLRAALEVGAAGIASKAAPPAELVDAIRTVAEGLDHFDPRLGSRLAEATSGAVLTPRERQILDMLARGRNGEEIAAELFLSPETVRTHVGNAMNKLAVRTRVHAVTEALRRREITL